MLTKNVLGSIRKLGKIHETKMKLVSFILTIKNLKKCVTDKTIYQNTNCCVNIQKRVRKTKMIHKYNVANNGRFNVYSHQKYISHNDQKYIVRNYSVVQYESILSIFETQYLYITKISNNFWQKQVLSTSI